MRHQARRPRCLTTRLCAPPGRKIRFASFLACHAHPLFLQEIEALLAESDDFKRLREEQIGSAAMMRSFYGGIVIAADRHNLNAPGSRTRFKLLADIEAIHARQHDVQDQEIRLGFADHQQSIDPVPSFRDPHLVFTRFSRSSSMSRMSVSSSTIRIIGGSCDRSAGIGIQIPSGMQPGLRGALSGALPEFGTPSTSYL